MVDGIDNKNQDLVVHDEEIEINDITNFCLRNKNYIFIFL